MFDEEERLVYEVRMQSLAEVESKIASAEEKGLEKGLEQGKHEVAKNMLALKIDINTVSQATGLSADLLKQLESRMK